MMAAASLALEHMRKATVLSGGNVNTAVKVV